MIGTQSVGGGPSVLFLMRRELVERRRWLTHREFLEDWALSKLSVGINLVALTGLEGLRVAGRRGLAVALAVFLIPTGAITAALTAVYLAVRDDALVRAALAGAGPVIAGMTVAIAYTFATQAVRRGWRGIADRGYAAGVVAVGLLAFVSPVFVIATGIVVGGLFLRGEPRRASGEPGG